MFVLVFYLDFNGVLNNWSMLEEVLQFLRDLILRRWHEWHVVRVRLRLLCFAGRKHDHCCCNVTKLIVSGIAGLLDSIVFTDRRYSEDRKDYWDPKRWVHWWSHEDYKCPSWDAVSYVARQIGVSDALVSYRRQNLEFERRKFIKFRGGKDQYIRKEYECWCASGREPSDLILVFVDDKQKNVDRVKDLERHFPGINLCSMKVDMSVGHDARVQSRIHREVERRLQVTAGGSRTLLMCV